MDKKKIEDELTKDALFEQEDEESCKNINKTFDDDDIGVYELIDGTLTGTGKLTQDDIPKSDFLEYDENEKFVYDKKTVLSDFSDKKLDNKSELMQDHTQNTDENYNNVNDNESSIIHALKHSVKTIKHNVHELQEDFCSIIRGEEIHSNKDEK